MYGHMFFTGHFFSEWDSILPSLLNGSLYAPFCSGYGIFLPQKRASSQHWCRQRLNIFKMDFLEYNLSKLNSTSSRTPGGGWETSRSWVTFQNMPVVPHAPSRVTATSTELVEIIYSRCCPANGQCWVCGINVMKSRVKCDRGIDFITQYRSTNHLLINTIDLFSYHFVFWPFCF